jgi:hypothetical protein
LIISSSIRIRRTTLLPIALRPIRISNPKWNVTVMPRVIFRAISR